LRVKIHKFKTIDKNRKGSQIQGWHLDLARMSLNWFLKSKSQLMTWLNKSKIKNWFGNRHIWILAPFFFNETTCFIQNDVVSFIVHKKKRAQNDAVLTALYIFFFPWMRCRKGKKVFFSLLTTCLSLSHLLKKHRHNPHPWPTTRQKKKRTSPAGDCLVATQLPYPFGAIR
jgi:hypothetical protein